MSQESPAVETSFYVRYAETDAMGVVHTCHYLVWFDEGRGAWLRAHGCFYEAMEAEGYFIVTTDAHVRYYRPAHFGDKVIVRTRGEAVRSRGFTLNYEVLNAKTGQRLATGESRHLCINRIGKAVPIPDKWYEALKRS